MRKLLVLLLAISIQVSFAAVDKYIVFEGTYSGNFTKEDVEVYRYNSYSKKWKLYYVPKKLIPKSFKVVKGTSLRFEMKKSTFKKLRSRKVAGYMK